MGYHPRQQYRDKSSFITSRTRNERLWFANNRKVEEHSLALLAKVTERYSAEVYAFGIQGNHHHTLANFPHLNRSNFMRDLNSGMACAVKRFTEGYPGGNVWARRYSSEIVPAAPDIERQFFYTVLQPVKDGLVSKLSEYPFYNCFHDAVSGIERKFKLVNWAAYNAARRYNPQVPIKDYIQVYRLRYARIPGYEHLSQEEYKEMMLEKLEFYRQEFLAARAREGKFGFVGREALLKVVPGTRTKNSKVSHRFSHRPRVLAVCPQRRAENRDIYFTNYFMYRDASKRFRAGEIDVQFPQGMCRPPSWTVTRPSGPYSPL